MCVVEKKPEELIKVTLEQIHLAEALVDSAHAQAREAGVVRCAAAGGEGRGKASRVNQSNQNYYYSQI